MKKKYIAPDLYFESYVLSQSIALGCAEEGKDFVNTWNGAGYFTSNNNDPRLAPCAEFWSDSDTEEYCYWDGSIKMFLS